VIRHAFSHPCLKTFIGKRNQWPISILSQVDWTSLGAACNLNHVQRHFVVKISHDLLPTCSLTTKYDSNSPAECPFCFHGRKDRDHLLQCLHLECLQWRSVLLPRLQTCCEPLHTDPVLLALLMQGLDNSFHHQPAPTPQEYPVAYRPLVHEQTTLGWQQLFNGRWSLQWFVLQDRYLSWHFDPVPDPLNSKKWTTAKIHFLWTSFWTLWELRNGQVYGVNSSTRAKKQKEKAHGELLATATATSSMNLPQCTLMPSQYGLSKTGIQP
jgi:hypothetical protein